MRCDQCRETMVPDPAFDSFDEHLTLRVTVWHCAGCGEVIEEILCEPEGDAERPRRMRYRVGDWAADQNQPAGRSHTRRRTSASVAAEAASRPGGDGGIEVRCLW
ncbi:MAG: hypothetical protein AB7G48_07400 [Nitrospiraceae bacterium]